MERALVFCKQKVEKCPVFMDYFQDENKVYLGETCVYLNPHDPLRLITAISVQIEGVFIEQLFIKKTSFRRTIRVVLLLYIMYY